MKNHPSPRRVLRRFPLFAALAVLGGFGATAHAAPASPIVVAVLAPTSIIPGKDVVNGAKLAAKDINAAGGVDGRPIDLKIYDTQLSSTGGINAMKKAVLQDHAVAVTGVFTTEVSVPLMPYAKRLNVPLIVESGASQIGPMVREHYSEYKNVFQLQINGTLVAQEVCDAAHDLFAEPDHGKALSAVVMSEQADWTRPFNAELQECLPKAGVAVKKVINYAVNTSDYSPIYSNISSLKPNLIITGMAHTGLAPVVQWHQNRVPALMLGFNIQAGTSAFWKASNGAAEDTIVVTNGAGGAAVTPKTPTFYNDFIKEYGSSPMLEAYTSYDMIYAVADAIKRAGTTETAAVVKQLEATNMVGVTGRIQFYGRDAKYAHALKYGPGLVTGVAFQWQDGKQVVVWPKSIAQGAVQYPPFVPHG
ncbi:MAG TPA: ABC transporter substrate-binding protein [Nevskiaceae bacterium]